MRGKWWICLLFLPSTALAASAEKQSFPAKGTKACRIVQYSSKYLVARGAVPTRTLPRPHVNRDGSVGMGLAEDTFPGTKVYFLIGKKRYAGAAGYTVAIDRAGIDELKKDPVIEFTYTRWPYRTELNGADVIEGFDSAYQDCLAFMRSSATN